MDAKKEAENPNTVPPGEFRQVMVHNPYTGRVDAIKFVGPECFVKGMGRLDDSPKSARLTRTPDGFRKRFLRCGCPGAWKLHEFEHARVRKRL